MLYFDDREKPYGWSLHKDAPLFDVPGMNNANPSFSGGQNNI
jgi:hypothetical protein